MLIRLPEWTLHPVKELNHDDAGTQTLICRDSRRPGFFTVNILERAALSETYVSDYLSLLERQTLPDFLDCRSKDGKLYMIFVYHPPASVQDVLKTTSFTLSQRLDAIESFLLWFLARPDLPSHLAGQLLREDNLNLSPEGRLYFNYFLKNPRHTLRVQSSSYPAMIVSLTEALFPADFARICLHAANGQYTSIKAFYLAIHRQISRESGDAPLALPQPKHKPASASKTLKITLTFLLLLISFLFLNAAFDLFHISPTYYVKSIGTVHIGD
jgi:hypothetical protein